MTEKRGYFIVVDGLDAVGKGEIIRALDSYEQRLGKAVFDTISFSKANRKGLPTLDDFWNPPETYFDTIITAEPTYAGVGHNLRNEIIAKNSRNYSSDIEIQSYSIDRLIQMERVVIPALKNGLNVLQSRCLASTLAYQTLRGQEEGKHLNDIKRYILSQEGSKKQLEFRPNLIIIPTIKDVDELINRIKSRQGKEKYDNAIFENISFQEKLKPIYESPWLKEIFESKGSVVKFLDADISIEESRNQAVEIYKDFLNSQNS